MRLSEENSPIHNIPLCDTITVCENWEALSKRGYSDALLEDIFYNNFLAMMERNDA